MPCIDCRAVPVNQSAIGKPYPPFEYEVGKEKIREYAQAVGEDNPVYFDRDKAKAEGFRDVPAPPMFAVVYSAGSVAPGIFDPDVGINFAMMVHGAQEFVWGEPVCAGDVITTESLGEGHLREGRDGLLRLRVGVAQPERRRGRARHLDQHREGGLVNVELKVTPDKYLPHRYAGASGRLQPDPHRRRFRQVGGLAAEHPPRPLFDGPGGARLHRRGRRRSAFVEAAVGAVPRAWASPNRRSS